MMSILLVILQILILKSLSIESLRIETLSAAAAAAAVLPVKLSSKLNGKPLVLVVRGGAAAIQDESNDSEDDDDIEDMDDDEFNLEFNDMEIAEDDFAEETIVGRLSVAWQKTPPITKAYLTGSMAATAYGYLLNKNQFPSILSYNWKLTWTRLQLWRPFTAFLNVGPFGLGYIMTVHFVWTYMGTLERLNHNRPYDFWIMMGFGILSMVMGYSILKLSPKFLGHNLSTFLVYIWSRYHEGLEVNMFELFNTKAELLPWFFLAQTFLLEGELPVLDFLGIVFGHIYHHCKTVGILTAPESLVAWYHSDAATGIRQKYKHISADFEI
jgi:Derlin-2/3